MFICQTQIISKRFTIPHPYKYKRKKNNAANCIEKLNIPTVSTAIFYQVL